MANINRRTLLQGTTFSAAALSAGLHRALANPPDSKRRQFTMSLNCGAIGVNADQFKAIKLAIAHGFESVTPNAGWLAQIADDTRSHLLKAMKDNNLTWGAAGLPVPFRGDDRSFTEGLKQLPLLARGLQQAGVTRMGTWIRPSHDELTYLKNFKRHATRLRACAEILDRHGIRLGFEYIGPKTLWASSRHTFIHTMAETKELIAEIGTANVGFVLDSWHWYTAHETVDDLLTLNNKDIVACDLNDAPKGIPIDEQIDSRRELPAATGVIDLAAFLGALVKTGYDGPVRDSTKWTTLPPSPPRPRRCARRLLWWRRNDLRVAHLSHRWIVAILAREGKGTGRREEEFLELLQSPVQRCRQSTHQAGGNQGRARKRV